MCDQVAEVSSKNFPPRRNCLKCRLCVFFFFFFGNVGNVQCIIAFNSCPWYIEKVSGKKTICVWVTILFLCVFNFCNQFIP
jgi:hypothetical protein